MNKTLIVPKGVLSVGVLDLSEPTDIFSCCRVPMRVKKSHDIFCPNLSCRDCVMNSRIVNTNTNLSEITLELQQ